MRGRNVNIYFQENTYNRIHQITGDRKISRFVNEAVEEKIQKIEKENNEKLKKQLIKGYQMVAKSKKRKTEDEIWDEVSSDGLK